MNLGVVLFPARMAWWILRSETVTRIFTLMNLAYSRRFQERGARNRLIKSQVWFPLTDPKGLSYCLGGCQPEVYERRVTSDVSYLSDLRPRSDDVSFCIDSVCVQLRLFQRSG